MAAEPGRQWANPNCREQLGDLTVAMLQGEHGHLRKEVERLTSWLERDIRPDLVNLSNILIAGCVPEIKRRLGVPVLITLQGDDLFLDGLVEPFKSQALAEIRRLVADVDGYIVSTRYYADYMSEYLGAAARQVPHRAAGDRPARLSSVPREQPAGCRAPPPWAISLGSAAKKGCTCWSMRSSSWRTCRV